MGKEHDSLGYYVCSAGREYDSLHSAARCRASGLGFGVEGLGFGVWGLGFGVLGLGLRVEGAPVEGRSGEIESQLNLLRYPDDQILVLTVLYVPSSLAETLTTRWITTVEHLSRVSLSLSRRSLSWAPRPSVSVSVSVSVCLSLSVSLSLSLFLSLSLSRSLSLSLCLCLSVSLSLSLSFSHLSRVDLAAHLRLLRDLFARKLLLLPNAQGRSPHRGLRGLRDQICNT